MALERAVLTCWYPSQPPTRGQQLWCNALAGFSLIFDALRRLRACWIRPVDIPVPVWILGNLTVGGSGKTPLVIATTQWMQHHGIRVGIIARGYGRRGTHVQCVYPDDPADQAGDEAVLIARKTQAPVAVGADRVAAARCLYAENPDLQLIISDDGLQHLRLGRRWEWIVVDPVRRWGNGRLLPAGPLREPLSRLNTADWVADSIVRTIRPPSPLRQWWDGKQDSDGAPTDWASWMGKRVHAVAGIAHPDRFFHMVSQQGVTVIPHPFPDHMSDLAHQIAFADDAWPVLMTEKDAVKCRACLDSVSSDRYWVVPVAIEWDPRLETACQTILQALQHTTH